MVWVTRCRWVMGLMGLMISEAFSNCFCDCLSEKQCSIAGNWWCSGFPWLSTYSFVLGLHNCFLNVEMCLKADELPTQCLQISNIRTVGLSGKLWFRFACNGEIKTWHFFQAHLEKLSLGNVTIKGPNYLSVLAFFKKRQIFQNPVAVKRYQ